MCYSGLVPKTRLIVHLHRCKWIKLRKILITESHGPNTKLCSANYCHMLLAKVFRFIRYNILRFEYSTIFILLHRIWMAWIHSTPEPEPAMEQYLNPSVYELATWFVCCMLYHVEARTKWLPFYRRHIQIHFRERTLLYFDSNLNEICYKGQLK